jgi:hypothetical protein
MLDSSHLRFDCPHRPARAFVRASLLAAAVMVSTAAFPVVAFAAQQHEAATTAETAPHGQALLQSIAKIVNFAILGGVLVYFLKTPLKTYLGSRATHIRQDLVTRRVARHRVGATGRDRSQVSVAGGARGLEGAGRRGRQSRTGTDRQAAAAERERLICANPPRNRDSAAPGTPTVDRTRGSTGGSDRRGAHQAVVTPEDQLRLWIAMRRS